jgi:RNA 2',3'-cyclic 3'-phosphodiesterase
VRLFAAVDPPADVRASLSAAIGSESADRARWVPPAQWHLTLAFYGEVDGGKVDKLQAGLARAAQRTQPFGLRLAGAGTFPRQAARARVLWIGIDGEVDAMRRLADRCAGAGRRARIAVDDRKFRPHLTLARARRETVDVQDVIERLSSYTSPWWTVTTLRLVHSTLGSVVRHETLREFELRLATDGDVDA